EAAEKADAETALLDSESSLHEEAGYVAPTPHYAVSLSGKIPEGYVAHARDACLTIDYQWDSSQPPLEWGDGGSFSEEWTTMHRRFRRGVQTLVDWYTATENPATIASAAARAESENPGDDFETVVVLVSHGAGCNALIGALTHQPALMDVGVASL